MNINESTCLWKFVVHKFYVDDGLTSVPTAQEALSLLKRTALKKEGNLRLHKIASNDPEVHQSLGLSWDLESDSFIFDIEIGEKPSTKRGFLSMLNSVYDPLGFVAHILINGKILLREITTSVG